MEKWRLVQKKGFTNLDDIAQFLSLDKDKKARLITKKEFPLHLPLRIAQKMPKNCLENPLALQFLPLDLELSDEGMIDPVGDVASSKGKALLHKYEGRALLLVTGACVMHCRYCFRQNYSYESEIDKAIAIIRQDPSIKEVILSGGDPLSLSDRALSALMAQIEDIDHVEIIRFHTRFLIGVPERVTDKFLYTLKSSSKQIVFVLHVNSALELDSDIFSELSKIQKLGVPVLTQTVLLKGVNDSKQKLYDLFWGLVVHGVIPYYLHSLDRVKGSLHMEVSKKEGVKLINSLRDCLPGYAVPTFVEEVAGRRSKTIINV
ncbi:MAG: L-lysine 2,3-aminomutase [Chlamydiia bacterium]|nr:L-lysine 2,3-aminomutase [Chlamydiia bacterium]